MRIGERRVGGLGGRGGISCNARSGFIGAGGRGSSSWRYHGTDSGGDEEDDSGGGMLSSDGGAVSSRD